MIGRSNKENASLERTVTALKAVWQTDFMKCILEQVRGNTSSTFIRLVAVNLPLKSNKQKWNRGFMPPSLSYDNEGGFFIGEKNIMFKQMKEDIAAVRQRDPAARSVLQILFLYPGVKALRMYRRAHWFHERGMDFIARWISQRAVRKTGIEIHPAAKIGKRFFIDHGTGVVIGETTEIGDDVTIYQGVTLGGTGKDVGKRHPTIGNNVLIGAGAKVLGPFKIGDNTNIAAGAVVLEEIPENSTAIGVPARVVKQNGERVDELDQVDIPNPIMQDISYMQYRLDNLERQLKQQSREMKGKQNEDL